MSKETKFTKGEWEIELCDIPIAEDESECYYILNDEGNCIADVYIQDDARLIKTAPKLYAALDKFISLVDDDHSEDFLYKYQEIKTLLAEVRGENELE